MTKRLPRTLYGVAYYDEYMPESRVDLDLEMMRQAGINVIRIAESTWGTMEPEPGVFNLDHIDVVLDAVHGSDMQVIIGTPTYAIPTWLAADHPDVLTTTANGQSIYGARQNMDITHPAYRYHAERAIRVLAAHTAPHPNVIGFQVDNETKYYDTAGTAVQRGFVAHLRRRFDGDLDALNAAFGLNYWSNRINAWEDFPNVLGTINGSLACAFDEYRRGLVTEFLAWQSAIIDEYRREDQFITQNFDFDWGPGWSYGLQPAVDHFRSADTVDLAGVDIYHPTQDGLTGREIAFGGDMTRSIKKGANYLVVETQAQGQLAWLPYPGQLRLQAFSHIASGADGVMYWHWHSIHNSFETYWKGLLSHDMATNPTFEEAGTIGADLERGGDRLRGLTKTNKVAIMVSNEALSALKWFGIQSGFPTAYFPSLGYNDILRWVYDALFDLNIEVDFLPITASAEDLQQYSIVVTPVLYTAPQSTLDALRAFVQAGGHLVSTFRSFVADENVSVWHDAAPHSLTDVFGFTYNQFTAPQGVKLALGEALSEQLGGTDSADLEARTFMELLNPAEDTEILATYDHHAWSGAAITRHTYGKGQAWHIGVHTSDELLRHLLRLIADQAGVSDWTQDLAGTVSVRRGINAEGKPLTWLLNYSKDEVAVSLPIAGVDVLSGQEIANEGEVTIPGWGALAIEGL
ncbi:MAG: beta-galactosidase [Actinomycetaceae bacterium]|nr:beta-galactosidase [Actinomycetaceae bacterium]